MRPSITGSFPGPNAKKLVERDERAMLTSTKTAPIVVASAKGCWLTDVDGNQLLDFSAGVGVVNAGHSNPRIVKAMQEQAAKLVHYAGTDYYNVEMVQLAERLAEIVPGRFAKKVFYTNSGTESNEAAMKLARYHSERPQFLAFYGAFHGRSMGSLSLTASKPVHRRGFFPSTPGVHHAPFPNPFRNVWGIDGYAHPDELTNRALDFIETELFAHTLPADEVAAIFVEPVQGEGGYVVPPKSFLPGLRKLADAHGILLALDEVQSGFGRTGKMFAQEHFGVTGDIDSLAKGIANGVPMGAIVARADLDYDVPGAHSNTFGGNAFACATALATLDALTLDGLVDNSATQGKHLHERLREHQKKHASIGDVRGLGLMQATEFTKRGTNEPDPKVRDKVFEGATKRGLVLLPCGKSGIRYIPPLVVTREEIDVAMDILGEALGEAGA